MPESSWLNLAIQIPVVVNFAYVMLKMQDRFLTHLHEAETRSEMFIREQREANVASLRDLTDRMCEQLDSINVRLDSHMVASASHDAFVKTSFQERFGPAVTARAEQAAKEAERQYTGKGT
jgi:hypothetical protein